AHQRTDLADQSRIGHRLPGAPGSPENLAVGIGHQCVQSLHQGIRAGKQCVGAFDRGHQLAGIGLVAHQHAQGAMGTFECSGHVLHMGQAAGQGPAGRGQGVEVVQQVTHLGRQARDLGRCIAPQHL
ncbi:hypothetical protein RZS08_24205, partial [Arthrospira platensis SPKY1]|nr:hypothetical protein [Arthrospira platensis SPKY1]